MIIDIKELFKVIIACVILTNILTLLGASTWLTVVCSMGMSFFWIPSSTK